MPSKVCSKCRLLKELSEFHRSSTNSDGHTSRWWRGSRPTIFQFEHAHGVVAKIAQHSDRLLLVRTACVAEGSLALGSMSLGTVSRLS